MRRSLVIAFSLAFLLVPIADSFAADPRAEGLLQTLRRLKAAFGRGDKGGEWNTLSPGFKRRLSRRAGRNVDVGDYITARNQYRNDPRIKELEQWMPTARMDHIRFLGGGKAQCTLWFGAPLLVGKSVELTMIQHALWQLQVRGEREPYWGFVGDRKMEIFRSRDGKTYTLRTKNAQGKVTWQKSWPANQVTYSRFNRWYFDGFGKMEQEFMRGVGNMQAQPRAPAARPR